MADVAAPAAPVAAPQSSSNGIQPPGGSGGEVVPGETGSPTRGPDGKFRGARADAPETKAKPAGDPTEGMTKAEEQAFFRRKMKLYGKDVEKVYNTQDDLARDLQRGLASLEREKPRQEAFERANKLIELARNKDSLEEFIREAGHDPEEWALERIAKRAELGMLTPEQRENLELKEKLSSFEKKELAKAEQEKQAEETKYREGVSLKVRETVFKALEIAGLPKTHETVFLLAETAKIAQADGAEYTPEELAKETEHRLNTYTSRYLGGLKGEGLLRRLGPSVVEEVLAAAVSDWEAKQDLPGPSAPTEPAPVQTDGRREYIDEAEVNRRLRKISGLGR